jgi:hypothetical protein
MFSHIFCQIKICVYLTKKAAFQVISGQSSAAIISGCKDLRVLAALSSQPLRAAERPG